MDNDLFDCHNFNTFDTTLIAPNVAIRKIAGFTVAFDYVAERCNLLYAIVLVLGNLLLSRLLLILVCIL